MGYYEQYLQKKQAISGKSSGTSVKGSGNAAYDSYLAKKALIVPAKVQQPQQVQQQTQPIQQQQVTPVKQQTPSLLKSPEVSPKANIDIGLTLDKSGNVIKKDQVNQVNQGNYGQTTISKPTKQTFWSSLKNKIQQIITPTDVVKDQVTYNLQKQVSKNLGVEQNKVPLDYIQKNREAITKELGIRNEPTTEEIAGSVFTLALITGLVEAPIATLIGAAGYQGTSELINLGVSTVQNEKYKPLSGKGLSDLLPPDINPSIKTGVDILQFALQAKAYKTLKAKTPDLAEFLTKDITTKYNLPDKLEIDKATVRQFFIDDSKLNPTVRKALIDLDLPKSEIKTALNQGINIETSWEKVITLTDKPYWSKVKSIFKIPASQPIITITNLQKPTTIGGVTALPENSVVLETNGKIDPGIYKSEEVINKVIGSELENTQIGNNIIKNALLARDLNKTIVITGTEEALKAPETIKKEEVIKEPVNLEKVEYDPTRLEKTILNPNTGGNPSNKYELQIRYKGWAADKQSFNTREEAQKALDNYVYKGLDNSVAEDYVGLKQKYPDFPIEFKKEQPKTNTPKILYHGTQATSIDIPKITKGRYGEGFYLTTSPKAAESFGKEKQVGNAREQIYKNANVFSYDISNLNIKEIKNADTGYESPSKLKSQGFDGVNYIDQGEIVIFNPEKLSKSKKVNKEVKEITPSDKFKSNEDYLKFKIGDTFKVVKQFGNLWKAKGNIIYIKPNRPSVGYGTWLKNKDFVINAQMDGNDIYKVELDYSFKEPKKIVSKKELTISPSTATTPKKLIKEVSRAGVNITALNLAKEQYDRPTIGKSELNTLLLNKEFRANPVLTVIEGNDFMPSGEFNRLLEFKGDKFKVTLDVRALNLNGDKLKIGDKITLDIEKLKKAPGIQQTRVFKGGKAFADVGGYSNIESVQKSLENIKSIEFPELLRLYTTLTNKIPALKAMRNYLGVMRSQEGGEGKIQLSYEIFKDPKLAVKVFAHELGHLTDFFPDKTVKRGNLLGRIASLRRNLKHYLPEVPGGAGPLTPQDRQRLMKEAKKLSQLPIKEEYEVTIGETKATPAEIISIWNDTMAGEKMPELMDWIKRLSESEKVEIVKGAIKGVLPEWANFGVLTKETRIREVIKNAPEDIKKKYQELVKEEIKKRALFTIEEVTKELKDLTQLWKPFNTEMDPKYTKYRFSSPELYADALSVLFNDPFLLKEKAPQFFKGFFNYLDTKPEVKENYFKLQEILNAGDETIFSERYKALEKDYKTAEETWLAQEIEKKNKKINVIGMLNTLFNDKNYVINKKVAEAIKKGIDISDDFNPVYDLSGLNYMEGQIKEFVHDNFQEAVTIASKVDNGWSELGKILQLERAIFERGELANPGGYDPKTAQWTLDKLEKKLGPEDWKTLQDAKDIFRKGMQELVNLAEKEGYYNPELIAQMKANKGYATFQVLDYLDKNVTSKIYQAKGTLKGVANPATSSLMKMVTTLRAIRYNSSKKLNLKFLKDLGELEPAKTKWNGFSKTAVDPRDPNKALVLVVIDGKTQGFYVDKEVGQILNHSKNETIQQLGKVTEMLTQTKIYRPLFTSINLGFQLFNFQKDFQRAWRNMPDKTLGQVLISWPKLVANYIKATPDAWKKAVGSESDIVREMEKSEIFGLNMNDMMGTPDPSEEEVTRVLRRIGVVSGIEGRSKLKTILKPVIKLFDSIEILGNYVEALPKIASYNMLKGKVPEKELAYFIRNYIGSPDFLVGGTATPVSNKMFLFSNAIKEGVKTDLNRAFKSKTKGAWWFKMLIGTVLPKMLQAAVALGLLGVGMKKMMDNVSEYDKTNYDIVTLGTDKKGKTIYVRIPKDESGRFVGAMTWKFMNMLRGGDKQTLVNNLTDIFSMWAGQVPGTSPAITGIAALSTYLSGKNPYDSFRNRNILTDTEFNAGFKYSWPKMLKWLIQNQGGSIVIPSYTPTGEMSNLEKVINLPVLSNMLGRFLKVSDYGQQEIDQKIKDMEAQTAAEGKIRRDEAINYAIREGLPLDITAALGHSPSSEDDLAKIKLMVKQMNIEKEKGKNVYIDNLIYANTNDAKVAMLKRYKETLTDQEFSDILTTAIENKIISADVMKDVFVPEPIPVPEEKKKLLNFDIKIVKTAYAAEGLETIKDKKVYNGDIRSKFKKFIDSVADRFIKRTYNPTTLNETPEEELKRQEESMLFIKDSNPIWYEKNIGPEVEKKLLGKTLPEAKIIGSASYYNPTNPAETREGGSGVGAYGRKIESGSVAMGNRRFQTDLKSGKNIYIKVDGMEDVKTPYGNGIFRVDDTMNKRYDNTNNIDFNAVDLNKARKDKGRFSIKYRVLTEENYRNITK